MSWERELSNFKGLEVVEPQYIDSSRLDQLDLAGRFDSSARLRRDLARLVSDSTHGSSRLRARVAATLTLGVDPPLFYYFRLPFLIPGETESRCSSVYEYSANTVCMPSSDEPCPNLEENRPRDSNHVPPTPLPTSQIAILWFFQLCEAIANSVMFPFVNELVKGLDVTGGDDRRVGYYVGLIDSTFFFTECLCVLQWGRLSDVIGRRPVICVGLLGLTLSLTCIGLSRTFGALILSRSLLGLTDGNIIVIRSALGDLADSTNIVQAFQYIPFCWNIGQTIGSLIGGYLSNPSKRFPKTFGDSVFWGTYPYLLPCLVAALFPLCGLILSTLFLRETVRHPWCWHGWRKVGRSKTNPESTSLLPHAIPELRNASLRSILTKRVIIAAANYCLLALVSISYSVLQPLFLSTPIQHGGLGLDPARIGYILAVQGVVAMTMAVFMVLFGAFPMMNAFARVEDRISWQVWFILAAQLVLHGLVEIGFGSMYILLTNASPSRAVLGEVNGLAQTAVSLVRAIGPASSTALFALSVEQNLMGGRLVFAVLLLVVVLGVGLSFLQEDGSMEENAE
ncbi:hypothetical protein BS47DRAFT_1485747 [Hydnum rufescens UP504]|uniref:Major facilitator superfamily (MFS) profile domain-containing protein n=1 Tax=Hydnum rufescens UP504 TaxID=1448309 RepID=A0A9P6AWL0_9AGAM|nr:hypothetical protein BS47DRAFT_1485747 [Hydnum rufescens UP504]